MSKSPIHYTVTFFQTANGRVPVRDWLEGLDITAQRRILLRLDQVRAGNLGDYKALGAGLLEFRIQTGPGFRLYFIRQGNTIVLLLHGGSKRTQARDIGRARRYLQEFREAQ